MKAIVAEIDEKQMIVITDRGDFIKVKRQMSAGIGDEIELKEPKTHIAYGRLARLAACFIVCIMLSTGVYAYYTPYSYVSVDINPSLALSLNIFERVIAVDPLSEDAADLIKDTKGLKNQDIDDALSDIIKSASKKGYIDEEAENQVMVVVSAKSPGQEKKLENKVTETAAKELSKVSGNNGVIVEKTSVESYKNAISKKVSPGKEILADKVREVVPEIKAEEINNMSVKEAMHLIKEGRKAAQAAEKEDRDRDKERDKDKDHREKGKGKNKHKGEIENALNKEEKEAKKEAAEAAKEIKEDKKKDGKTKPAAASKESDEKDEKVKPAAKDRVEKAKDGKEELKKKDKPDRDKETIKEKDTKDSKHNDSKPKGEKSNNDEKKIKDNKDKGKLEDKDNRKDNK